jgi:hypothetical protein
MRGFDSTWTEVTSGAEEHSRQLRNRVSNPIEGERLIWTVGNIAEGPCLLPYKLTAQWYCDFLETLLMLLCQEALLAVRQLRFQHNENLAHNGKKSAMLEGDVFRSVDWTSGKTPRSHISPDPTLMHTVRPEGPRQSDNGRCKTVVGKSATRHQSPYGITAPMMGPWLKHTASWACASVASYC